MTAALEARGVGISFGGVRALDSVDITVGPREIVGLIGPNGAGKTTFFDCVSGLVPGEGTVLVAGRDVSRLAAHDRARAGLGRSFQDARLFASMSVLDVLTVAAERHQSRSPGVVRTLLGFTGLAEQKARKQAADVVDAFGLGSHRDKLVGELSTGTRRVVDLAGIVVQRPSVVLLDEPSSGLAQREAEALVPLLQKVRADLDCALVVIEHDMPLLLGISERVYALETGRVIAEGSPQEVVRHPEVVRSYLGDDPAAIARSGATKRKPA
jgi:branched-chain amino acid transport system ATP-binding protein